MDKFSAFLDKHFLPFAGRIAAQRHLQALRDGIILTMPLIIIGSIFLILGFIPIPGYSDFMVSVFGAQWLTKLLYPVDATFGIIALIAGFGIAYRLAEKYGIDPLTAGAISVSGFLLATPFQVVRSFEGFEEAMTIDGVIPIGLMGSGGLFVAMLIAILSTEVYRFITSKNIVIRMPDGVPPAVSKSFIALIPGFIVISLIWLMRILIEMTSFESLHNVVGDILYTPLSALGGSLIGSMIAVTLVSLLWFTGLHGASIVGGVMSPIWLSATDQNRIAFQAGEEVPHIFTAQFFDIFINMGGSGATFALVMIMLLWSRSKQMKQLGRLSAGPGAFNINEPIIFGTPIVMNPILIVPFFLTPLTMTVLTYFAMSTGLVAKPVGIAIPWTTPPIIGGYLVTQSISGAVMQIVNIGVGLLIWLPFFKVWDRQKVVEEGGSTTPSESTEDKKAG